MEQLSPKRAKAIQFALMVTFFTQGVAALSWIPRIPEFIANLNVSKELWGTMIGIGSIGALIPLIFTNKLINRFGTTPIIKVTAITMCFLFLVLPYPTAWPVFLSTHFVLSFVISTFNIALNSQAVAFQKRLGRVVLGSLHGAWSIGAASSAFVTSIIATFTPLKVQMLVIPVIALGLYIWTSRQLFSSKEDSHGAEQVKTKSVSWLKSPKYLWFLSIGLFAGMFPELMVMDWSSVYSKEVLHLDAARSAWPYTVWVAAMILGRFSIGRLTKRTSINRLSQIGGFFGAASMAMAIFTSSYFAESNQSLALFCLCFFFAISGFGISSMVPSFYGAAGYVKGLSTPAALSRMALFNSLVVIFARMLMGSLTERFSLPLAMIFPIVMFVIAGIISGMVVRRNKRLEAEEALAYPPTSPVAISEVAD